MACERNRRSALDALCESGSLKDGSGLRCRAEDLLRALARAGDAPGFSSLEARIKETQAEVRRVFQAVVEGKG